jgi:hypothetical protein
MAAVLINRVRFSFHTNVVLLVWFGFSGQDMLRNLSLWFFKMFPHDAMAGANEIAVMAVEGELSVIGSTDSNMASDEE